MRNGKFEMENGRKSFVLGIALLIAAVAFTLSACTVYDNYDIELMEAETADVSGDDPADLSSSSESKEVDEKSSSSKNGKDTSVIIIINQNSSSSEEAHSSSSEAEPVSSNQGDSFACGEATVTGKDLHEYKTVLVGKTCWITENMRYKPKNGIARCYGEGASDPDLEPDAEKNCEEYGLLYDFETATGVCPTGWRLPTIEDFENAVTYSGAVDQGEASPHFKAVGKWPEVPGSPIAIDDLLGLSVLPGGFAELAVDDVSYDYSNIDEIAYIWTSDAPTAFTRSLVHMKDDDDIVYFAAGEVEYTLASVRCVKK
ncbi:MAG: hypothetical protein IKO21_11960 [Fibrobacter sp.]|nr:hypothetical protein [Fibrobacter sp.]